MPAELLHVLPNLFEVIEDTDAMTLVRALTRLEDPELVGRLSRLTRLLESFKLGIELEVVR